MDPALPPTLPPRFAVAILRLPHRSGVPFVSAMLLLTVFALVSAPISASELRRTAMVRAIERVRPAIVNIRGQKTVRSEGSSYSNGDGARRVNGMGTGVIMDQRGYIVTNFHVIDGVSRINVTLDDGSQYVAKLISHDPRTDLALIKINSRGKKLQIVPLGTSNDLMPGEPVVAVGNAYGYEHTVTRGIISALNRTVQVSDTQSYRELIQTDASINPGNSGGPLLNIDGEMIGLNVAVRVGAQGIGFALPVDRVLEVSSNLMSVKRIQRTWHGVVSSEKPSNRHRGIVVKSVEANSPAATGGVLPGDVIRLVDGTRVDRPFDLERSLIGKQAGSRVELAITRKTSPMKLDMVLASLPSKTYVGNDRSWNQLGLKLQPVSSSRFRDLGTRYRGGLSVTQVRSSSSAENEGIRRGDILVGLHIWETVSADNVSYVLSQSSVSDSEPLKFYIIRDGQTLYGYLDIEPTR